MHAKGLHFVGDWHTHPEAVPTPSSSDIRTIKEAVAKSRHHLHGFLDGRRGKRPFSHRSARLTQYSNLSPSTFAAALVASPFVPSRTHTVAKFLTHHVCVLIFKT